MSSRQRGGRTAPIDAHASGIAESGILPARYDKDAAALIDCASSLTRLKIVRALVETSLPATDLARVVGRTPAATSQHIKVLRDIGAVTPLRSGNIVRYRLAAEPSARVLEAMARALDLLRDR